MTIHTYQKTLTDNGSINRVIHHTSVGLRPYGKGFAGIGIDLKVTKYQKHPKPDKYRMTCKLDLKMTRIATNMVNYNAGLALAHLDPLDLTEGLFRGGIHAPKNYTATDFNIYAFVSGLLSAFNRLRPSEFGRMGRVDLKQKDFFKVELEISDINTSLMAINISEAVRGYIERMFEAFLEATQKDKSWVLLHKKKSEEAEALSVKPPSDKANLKPKKRNNIK